jgi:2-oxoglutarate dehydrogenase E2 component (dihydrolipoamide succinyltransferase)
MPKLGESIMEATVLKWYKQPGDTVNMDETVLEIATDKVDSEVPSTAAGVVEEILFHVNDVVPIGTVIARIRTNAAETVSSKPVVSTPAKESHSQPAQEAMVVETIQP